MIPPPNLGSYKFTTELSPYFTSRYNPDPDGIFPSSGDYVRLDAKLTLALPDGRWTIDVIGKNLTNRIIIAGTAGSAGSAAGPTTKEEPLNVAAQVRYRW